MIQTRFLFALLTCVSAAVAQLVSNPSPEISNVPARFPANVSEILNVTGNFNSQEKGSLSVLQKIPLRQPIGDKIREIVEDKPLQKIHEARLAEQNDHQASTEDNSRLEEPTIVLLPQPKNSSSEPQATEVPQKEKNPESSEPKNASKATTPSPSQQIELEIRKPLSISREQLVRFRKFLTKKGITVKHPEDDVEEELTRLNIHHSQRSSVERLSDVTAEDILPLLPRNLSSLMPVIHRLRGSQCQRHGEYFLQGLHNLTKWAVQMFDAGTKIPEGVLYGSNFHFGNFDECLDVSARVPDTKGGSEWLRGQYCLATVMLSGLKQDQVKADPVDFGHTAWDTLKVPEDRRGHRKDMIHWAFCVPAACSAEDVQTFLNIAIDASSLKGLQLDFEVAPNMCQVERELLLDGYDVALGVVVAIFLMMVGAATVFDLQLNRSSLLFKKFYVKILLCFSAYTNLVKLRKYTPNQYNLDCIFGIKAITMILILMGHATAFLIGGPSMNSNYKEEAVLKVENGILLNNPLLVDTFLMIGAFLLCRLLLVELEKRKFINPLIIYVARYVRLTPAYAIVIAIYSTWFYKMGSGPLWESKVGLERERCISSWWANILYINNYANSEYLCMFQSWYLAVDTQFFLLAPLVIYPLWRWRGFGEVVLVVTTLVSIVIPFTVTFVNHLDPVLMMYAKEISDLSSNPMYRTTYIKTHMRGMSYMIGIFLGYIIHRIQSSSFKVPKTAVWCGWIASAVLSCSAMFSVAVFYRRPYDAFEAASYAALHRVGWCLGVAWVIFACVTNNAGPLDKFLRWRSWVVLSRLSYCSYLVNGLVELHTIGTLRHTRNLTNLQIAKETISHVMITYALALVFSIFFEAPILSVENLFLKNATKGKKEPEDKVANPSISGESTQSANTDTTA